MKSALIEAGDTVWNSDGVEVEITEVNVLRSGLLLRGMFSDGLDFEGFAPYELSPATRHVRPWYNWSGYSWLTLTSGVRIGLVAMLRGACPSLEAYEVFWQETLKALKGG